MSASPEGVSVLAQMAAATMSAKVAVARTLTPTGAETPVKSMDPTSILPNDVPGVFLSNERLTEAAAQLRAQAQLLLDVAEGIDVLLGIEPAAGAHAAGVVAIDAKLAEREADRRAADREAAAGGDARAAAREEAAQERDDIQAVEAEEPEVPGTALSNMVEDIITEDRAAAQQLADLAALSSDDPDAFAVRMAELKAQAQASAFGEPEPADDGWTCPTHGTFKVATSKRGRQFRKCGEECGLIEAL